MFKTGRSPCVTCIANFKKHAHPGQHYLPSTLQFHISSRWYFLHKRSTLIKQRWRDSILLRLLAELLYFRRWLLPLLKCISTLAISFNLTCIQCWWEVIWYLRLPLTSSHFLNSLMFTVHVTILPGRQRSPNTSRLLAFIPLWLSILSCKQQTQTGV